MQYLNATRACPVGTLNTEKLIAFEEEEFSLIRIREYIVNVFENVDIIRNIKEKRRDLH
jgi:hypothetical protein